MLFDNVHLLNSHVYTYTSEYSVKSPLVTASGDIHASGIIDLLVEMYSSYFDMFLAKPKSEIFKTLLQSTKTLRQARSRCMMPNDVKYSYFVHTQHCKLTVCHACAYNTYVYW